MAAKPERHFERGDERDQIDDDARRRRPQQEPANGEHQHDDAWKQPAFSPTSPWNIRPYSQFVGVATR